LVEVPQILDLPLAGEVVPTKDHRTIQMLGYVGLIMDMPMHFARPEAVGKTCPQFFPFLKAAAGLVSS
jgi:5-enolpyruvylshikimate-3-phosphate synthase